MLNDNPVKILSLVIFASIIIFLSISFPLIAKSFVVCVYVGGGREIILDKH